LAEAARLVILLTGFMVVTMSGSPPTGLGSPGSSQAEFSGDYAYLGFARAGRVSPPLSKKEADQTLSWLSVARPTVDTKLDEYVEGEKQWSEKELMRQKLLDKAAAQAQEKADREAREKAEWKKRMQQLEHKERVEKDFKDRERKIQLQEWKDAVDKGHSPTQWADYNKVVCRPPLKQTPGF